MRSVLLCIALLVAAAQAFVAPPLARPASCAARSAVVTMGPAKDGPFTPAVKLARVVLGDQQLLKLRGKAIAYHSQFINDFCSDCASPAPAYETTR